MQQTIHGDCTELTAFVCEHLSVCLHNPFSQEAVCCIHHPAFLIQLFLCRQKIADMNRVIHKSCQQMCQSRRQIQFLSFNFKSEKKKTLAIFCRQEKGIIEIAAAITSANADCHHELKRLSSH